MVFLHVHTDQHNNCFRMSSLEFQVILQLLDERLQDSSHDIQLVCLAMHRIDKVFGLV